MSTDNDLLQDELLSKSSAVNSNEYELVSAGNE